MPGFFLLSQDKGACCLISIKMNPKIAEEHAVRPYMAAQSRISEFAKSHNLKSRPHACYALVV